MSQELYQAFMVIIVEALIYSLSAFHSCIFTQYKEWDDANSKLFKESHDEAVHKDSYESRLCELISASLAHQPTSLLAH